MLVSANYLHLDLSYCGSDASGSKTKSFLLSLESQTL